MGLPISTRPRRTGPALPSSPCRPKPRFNATSASKLKTVLGCAPGEGSNNLGERAFTFESRVPLPSDVKEHKQLATDRLLLRLAYKLNDDMTSWYHPETLFRCANAPSEMPSLCNWQRGTIFRYPVATGTVDMIGSLYRPRCINKDCQWNEDPPRVMRLKLGRLVQMELDDVNLSAIPKRFSGRLAERNKNLAQSTTIGIELDPRKSDGESTKKRKTRQTGPSRIGTFASKEHPGFDIPTLLVSPPGSSTLTKKRKVSPEAEPSYPQPPALDSHCPGAVANDSKLGLPPSPETQIGIPPTKDDGLEGRSPTSSIQKGIHTGSFEDLPQTNTVVKEIVEKIELRLGERRQM